MPRPVARAGVVVGGENKGGGEKGGRGLRHIDCLWTPISMTSIFFFVFFLEPWRGRPLIRFCACVTMSERHTGWGKWLPREFFPLPTPPLPPFRTLARPYPAPPCPRYLCPLFSVSCALGMVLSWELLTELLAAPFLLGGALIY